MHSLPKAAAVVTTVVLVGWGGAIASAKGTQNMHAMSAPAPMLKGEDTAMQLANAMFTGDVDTVNRLFSTPKTQQDLSNDHARKHALIGEPVLVGAPRVLANGNTVYHIVAKTRSPAGKDEVWNEDLTVSAVTHKVVSVNVTTKETSTGNVEN